MRKLSWLQESGCIDKKAFQRLPNCLKGKVKILIVGNAGSGKSTVAEVFHRHFGEHGQSSILFPEFSNLEQINLKQNKSVRELTQALKLPFPVIWPLGYQRDLEFDEILPLISQWTPHFDLIVDLRRWPGGERKVCQIFYRKGKRLVSIYKYKSFEIAALHEGWKNVA